MKFVCRNLKKYIKIGGMSEMEKKAYEFIAEHKINVCKSNFNRLVTFLSLCDKVYTKKLCNKRKIKW